MTGTDKAKQAEDIASQDAFSPDSEQWARLKSARDPKVFVAAWLEIQCRIIGSVVQGVVVLRTPDRGTFAPLAVWPEGASGSPGLSAAIETAIAQRRSLVQLGKESHPGREGRRDVVACPVLLDDKMYGAVAVEVEHCSAPELRVIMSQLEWGGVWIEALLRRNKFTPTAGLVAVLETVATSLHHDRFQAAATAVVTELAGSLGCERVSIGFLKGKHTQVRALSHSASFSKKANLIRAIEAAMDEAVDQQATIVYPAPEDGPIQVTRAHAGLQQDHGGGPICTIPFAEEDRILGALTLEQPPGEPLDTRTVKLCEHAASLLGPVLEGKRKNDRWLYQKAIDSMRGQVHKLIGPRHVATKLSVFAALSLLVFFALADGDYRVTADAALEGTVQRVVASPMAGYVAQANVRAGDIVKAGDVLFSLDERDLRLERLKWVSQRSQRRREYSEALAGHDRAKVRILGAQIEQAEAQIALLDEQLERLHVVAPFDGFVVSGDLSQSLGAPVERGDVLFEVAPLNAYRVILEVDEREIGSVSEGQTGQLALSGMPGETFPIVIEKITPVSTAKEGRNYFEVEARLMGDASAKLRPGMEGVGKINIEPRKLIWIWTHKIIHWMRMFFWSWWP